MAKQVVIKYYELYVHTSRLIGFGGYGGGGGCSSLSASGGAGQIGGCTVINGKVYDRQKTLFGYVKDIDEALEQKGFIWAYKGCEPGTVDELTVKYIDLNNVEFFEFVPVPVLEKPDEK